MSENSQTVSNLIDRLGSLPGIGKKSAERLAYHLLRVSKGEALALADAIRDVRDKVCYCSVCFNLAEAEFIQHWLDDRSDVLGTWPADVLHRLLGKVLDDDELTEEEVGELTDLLVEITGEPVSVIFY